MRIASIGTFSAYHTEADISNYLEEAGHTVDRYQYNYLNKEHFIGKSNDYDMVICSLPQTLPVDFWQRITTKKVAWYFDWIWGWQNREAEYIPRLQHFDLILSTDGYKNPIYNGLNRYWLPHAVDTKTYYPVLGNPTFDCAFIGHIYTPYRKRIIDNVKAKYSFTLLGLYNECWGPGYVRACNQAKIIIGDNCRNDVAGYWSDRLYMTLACGGFMLFPAVPGIEDCFTPGKHLVTYSDEADLHDKIDYYLAHEDERKAIAKAGAEFTAKNHNWAVRVKEAEELWA